MATFKQIESVKTTSMVIFATAFFGMGISVLLTQIPRMFQWVKFTVIQHRLR